MDEEEAKKVNIQMIVLMIQGMIQIIMSSIFFVVLYNMFSIGANQITKIVIVPFMVCGIAIFIRGLVTLFHGIQVRKIRKSEMDVKLVEKIEHGIDTVNRGSSKLFLIGFFVFWFGFLIIMDYMLIRDWSGSSWQMLAFSIIFWVAGIYMLRKRWRETRKNKGTTQKEKIKKAAWMSKYYFILFFTFWFGVLIILDVASIITWSRGGWMMFVFSLPFWIVGITAAIKVGGK